MPQNIVVPTAIEEIIQCFDGSNDPFIEAQVQDVKAVHVLVPQIEHAVRSIVGQLDKPVTKPHPKIKGASVTINLGDILYSDDITQVLGPDLTFYLLALYADPVAQHEIEGAVDVSDPPKEREILIGRPRPVEYLFDAGLLDDLAQL